MGSKGKYADVIGDLPRYRNENPKYREKVENRRKEIEQELGELALDPQNLTRLYIQARKDKDELEEKLKAADLDIEAITGLLADRFEVEGVKSITLDTGDNVRVQHEPYAVVEDKDVFWGWCVDNDLGPLLQLPWQTTNSMMKERLVKNEEPMPGVKAFNKPKAVFTKAKA